MRAPRFALLGLCPLLLAGCFFTANVRTRIEESRWVNEVIGDTLFFRLPVEPSHLFCPKVGDNLYVIAVASDSLWLQLPTSPGDVATLSDQPPSTRSVESPGSGPSGNFPAGLDLVIGTNPRGFVAEESEGVPANALLCLASLPSPGDSTVFGLVNHQAMMIYREKGRNVWVDVDVKTPRRRSRADQAESSSLKALYFLSVPADIVTSPIQVFIFLVTLPIRAVGLIGFAGT